MIPLMPHSDPFIEALLSICKTFLELWSVEKRDSAGRGVESGIVHIEPTDLSD